MPTLAREFNISLSTQRILLRAQTIDPSGARARQGARCQSVKEAETILLRARELHHDNAMIEFNLACYASVTGRFEDAKKRLQRAIELDKEIRKLALDDEDLSAFLGED
jgi:Flp pilus assembly protein TadD